MLDGRKHLAVFYDVIQEGRHIPDAIIPETAFAPFVPGRKIMRFTEDIRTMKSNTIIRYVCFTTPGEEWRANAFFWSKREGFSGRRPFDDAYEFFIGRLLGYEESDIEDFVSASRNKTLSLKRQGHQG